MKKQKVTTVDAYIQTFPDTVAERLRTLRESIRKAVPTAEEKISYGMPAYALNGPLVYFAGYASYIGFYATPSAHTAFKKELLKYKTSKGTAQFPHDAPLPLALIRKMILFRMKENALRQATKKVKSKKVVRK